ncbi:hypothetical protein G210_4323, partial [Candida maltosa Xu316]
QIYIDFIKKLAAINAAMLGSNIEFAFVEIDKFRSIQELSLGVAWLEESFLPVIRMKAIKSLCCFLNFFSNLDSKTKNFPFPLFFFFLYIKKKTYFDLFLPTSLILIPMKSSIFSKSGSPPTGPRNRKQPNSSTRKPQSSSPYINNSKLSTSTSTSTSNTNGSTSKRNITWNLDDMISHYQNSGELPPILSPTLPEATLFQDDTTQDENEKKVETPVISAPKPSYPKKRIMNEEEDEDSFSSDDDTPIRQLKTRKVSQENGTGKGNGNISQDDIPISMLSPTLPSMFDNSVPSLTTTPVNEDSRNNGTSFTNRPTKVANFKWINKLHDTSKPKFLLRFTVNNLLKYKKHFNKPATPSKLSGFKITTENNNDTKKKDSPQPPPPQAQAPPKIVIENTEKTMNNTKEREELMKEKEMFEKQVKKFNDKEKDFIRDKEIKERGLQDQENSLKQLEKLLNNKEKELQDLELKLKTASTASVPPTPNPAATSSSSSTSANESEQKLRNQLQKLTQDIMKKEQFKSLDEESKRFRIDDFNKDVTPHLSRSQREDVKFRLQDEKNSWLQISKIAQTKADKCDDELIAMIIQVDTFILRMVSYDYDERSKIISGVLPSERSWKLLDQDIDHFISTIEKKLKSGKIKDKFFLDFCKILKCILFQTRGLLIKRVNGILSNVIQSYIEKKNTELNGKIIELQQMSINNNSTIMQHFMNSNPSYLNAVIPTRFPMTWYNKCLNLEEVQLKYNLTDIDTSIKPNVMLYYLPFGNYSNLNELTAFLFNVLKEFIDIYNKYNSKTPIKYSLQSGI